jgi:AcrR family transcriptional regulator
MEPDLTPRQRRSAQTQERLLDALEALLNERVFEQISIQDIATAAGVAVGTVYRRFRNKEALLPALYRRLDERYDAWAATVWRSRRGSRVPTDGEDLRELLLRLVAAHVSFYRRNAPLLRTLYLQVRLDAELADPAVGQRRQALYESILAPVFGWFDRAGRPPPSTARVRCFVLLLLSPLTERSLFPDNTPARSLRLSDRRFAEELAEALFRYLAQDAG